MKRISSEKILSFVRAHPERWHEGLEKEEVMKLKQRSTGKFKKLLKQFYWKKADSYVIQDLLDGHVFCISKDYWESLTAKP